MGRPTPKINEIYKRLAANEKFTGLALNLRKAYQLKDSELLSTTKKEMAQTLTEEFRIYQHDLHEAIIQKVTEGKSKKGDGFGISYFIDKNRYDDIDYRVAEIHIEPGATQSEVIKFIQDNWRTIKTEQKAGLEEKDFAKKQLRKRTYAKRDRQILKLHEDGYADKQISDKLEMGGQIDLIRKIISNQKKRSL